MKDKIFHFKEDTVTKKKHYLRLLKSKFAKQILMPKKVSIVFTCILSTTDNLLIQKEY